MTRRLIFLSGPTASGKSALAIKLALKFKGVIFNCDSIQVYNELNVGAAKPTPDEFNQVPHFLFNIATAPSVMSVALYLQKVKDELARLAVDVPIFVVGGTGFYFLALEKGLYEIPKTPNELKQSLLEELSKNDGKTDLFWKEILIRDPEWAKKNHPNDQYRILRAMEILRNNNENISQLKQKKSDSLSGLGQIFKLHLRFETKLLEDRIRIRAKKMLKDGLLQETQNLIDLGLSDWAPLNSVGYFEAKQYLRHPSSIQQLEDQITIATRQLAKKQRTWFQRDLENHFLDGSSDQLYQLAEAHLARILS
jgi:tRNA dimethylallyltransferase